MSNNLTNEESKIKEQIRFKPVDTDPNRVYTKLWRRISESEIVAKGGVSPVWRIVSVAASVALLVFSSLFFVDINTGLKPLAQIEISTLAGSKTQVLLPDSTVVWLNGDSWMRYPESFDGSSRQIELIGEALFHVTTNKEKPFVVALDGMRVQVLGTEFNLLSADKSGVIETTLIKGSVALFSSDNYTSEPDCILLPGEQALFNKQNGQIEVRQVQAVSYASWVTGHFYFEKATFGEIIQVLERHFNVEFHLKNKSLENVCLTAQFTHQESLDQILSILRVTMKYSYEIKNKDIYIR